MFDRLVDRVNGEVSLTVQRRAASRLPVLAERMIDSALCRWAANGWHRFDDSEVSCTVQLYRWMQDARRTDRSLAVITVSIEHVVVTPDMLAGHASPTTAKRPDLRLSTGSAGVSVECKRLEKPSSWQQDYVDKGMARFVTSAYGAGETLGVMVGYLRDVTADACLPPVNQFVLAHPAMGKSHELDDNDSASYGKWLQSEHARSGDVAIRLTHVWVHLN